jgi:hypothetical protein
MHFLSDADCRRWLADRSRKLPGSCDATANARLWFPKSPFGFYSWARSIVRSITFDQPCLLWIVEWGIWASSENWSLYGRLKRSYDDLASLPDKPGHLFDSNESDDLVTFMQLTMMFGWGGYLLTEANRVNAFVSHDEFMDIFSEDEQLITALEKSLGS